MPGIGEIDIAYHQGRLLTAKLTSRVHPLPPSPTTCTAERCKAQAYCQTVKFSLPCLILRSWSLDWFTGSKPCVDYTDTCYSSLDYVSLGLLFWSKRCNHSGPKLVCFIPEYWRRKTSGYSHPGPGMPGLKQPHSDSRPIDGQTVSRLRLPYCLFLCVICCSDHEKNFKWSIGLQRELFELCRGTCLL